MWVGQADYVKNITGYIFAKKFPLEKVVPIIFLIGCIMQSYKLVKFLVTCLMLDSRTVNIYLY
jgi:hypothetical protein